MIVKRFGPPVALAVTFLTVTAALRYAASQGFIGEDLATRTVQVVIGLGLAAYANLIPKNLGRLRASAEAETRTRAAQRVGGWSIALAGLAHAGLWAFAPLSFASAGSMVVVGGAVIVTLGYALWCLARRQRA